MDPEGSPRAATHEIVIPIDGMTCAACAGRIAKVVSKVDGVRDVDVSFAAERARVVLDSPTEQLPLVLERIRTAGYAPRGAAADLLRDDGAGVSQSKRSRWDGAPTAFALVIGLVQMTTMLVAGHHSRWVAPFQLVSTLPVLLVGRHFFVRALAALRAREADMNVLVAVGTGTAMAYSTAVVLLPSAFETTHDVHFESVTWIIALVGLGKVLETRAKRRATRDLHALHRLVPERAMLRTPDGSTREVAARTIARTEIVVLSPGARAPVDGIVVTGTSELDESSLTGESTPRAVGPGDAVRAGAVNLSGAVDVRATAVGSDTMLARVVRLVETAQTSRAPVQRLADRVSRIFVPTILLVAAGAASLWWMLGPAPRLEHALVTFVSVVVVSCPCALGLATPMALVVGIGRAAREGVVFRSGEALELTASVDTVALDKTGTLTEGRPGVSRVVASDEGDRAVIDLLTVAASVERSSEHPIARAIVAEAERRGAHTLAGTAFRASPGLGASLEVDGVVWRVGTARWLASCGVSTEGGPAHEASPGDTLVAIARGTTFAGWIAVRDSTRREACAVVRRLDGLGLATVVLSGDRGAVVAELSREVGISEAYGDLLPADKLDHIERLEREGRRVAMVGDGVNDAPALARATVGMAMGTGTDTASEACDVTLLAGGLAPLPRTIVLARATMRTVRRNLAWAFAYNIALVPVAAGALYAPFGITLAPAMAALAMTASSLSVVLSSLWLGRLRLHD